jgi:hypothetical protein
MGLVIWEPFPPGVWHDDGVYVLLSRALANGEGLRYTGVPGAFLAPKFPPLFPLVLSPVWIVSPSFPENAAFFGAVNLLILAVSGGLMMAFFRRRLGLPVGLAGTVVGLALISPVLWRVAMIPLSEPLFLLTVVLSLWAGARMEEEEGLGSLALFLLAGGLAIHTRSLGIAVLLGGAGALLLRRRWKRGLWILLGSVAVALPWALWSRWAAQALPGSLKDILGPYGGWLLREMGRDPLAYLGFLVENGGSLLARTLSLLLPGVTGPPLWTGLLLVPVLGVGLREIGKKSLTLPLVLLFTLLVLLLWPFQAVRLLTPFQPLFILAVVIGFHALLTRLVRRGHGRWAVGLLAGCWVTLFVTISLFRLFSGWPGELYRVRSDAGRQVAPSARFLPLAKEEPSWGTPEAQFTLWEEAGLTHVLVEHGGGVHGEALDRIDAVCPPGTVEVLEIQPGQILVALNWDETCRALLAEGS